MPTSQRKEQLKKFWYDTDQLTDLKRHYLGNLKGVGVAECSSDVKGLEQTVEAFNKGDKDVVNFGFRVVSRPNNAHFIDVTIAKDKDANGNPTGKVLVLAQDSEGHDVTYWVRDKIKDVLGRKYGPENVTFVDCQVKQQKNNIDCGPLTVTNGVDNVASILQCYKDKKSIIEAATEIVVDPATGEGKPFFQSKLSIQEPKNLTKLRAEHAGILQSLGKSAEGVRVQKGSVAEEEESKAGPNEFEYKRKKPLSQDDFQDLLQQQQAKKPEKKSNTVADVVAGAITAFFDWIIYGLGLEKKPVEKKTLKAAGTFNNIDGSEEAKQPTRSVDEISLETKKQAEELGKGSLLPPTVSQLDTSSHLNNLTTNKPSQSTGRGGRS